MQALRSAASGMTAQQLNLEVTAHNIANVNTPGFKRGEVRFTEMLERGERVFGGTLSLGTGAKVAEVARDMGMGLLENRGDGHHLAIQGEGFFQVMLPDGGLAYTRAGLLGVSSDGTLTLGPGLRLEPPLRLPEGTSSFTVTPEGLVTAVGEDGTEREVGRVVLSVFVNPGGLAVRGDGLLLATEASGQPVTTIPGLNGAGKLCQGLLERSNVDLANELTNLIVAQRIYQMNAKMAQTADEAAGIANNILRS